MSKKILRKNRGEGFEKSYMGLGRGGSKIAKIIMYGPLNCSQLAIQRHEQATVELQPNEIINLNLN